MFLAHFAVRSFELLGRNTRCVCELLPWFVASAKIIPKDGNFVFLAHFAVRSFELLGRNTRCVCELLPWFVASIKIIQNGCELCVLHTLQWGLSNYLVEIPGVLASFCRDLLQAPKLFQKDASFVFLAHFAVRSFELLGRNTRCVCELLPWFVASAKIIPKDASFVFLAHFAVRSFELLGRNTRCVCELLPWFVASAKIIPKGCELCVSCTLCSEVFRTTW